MDALRFEKGNLDIQWLMFYARPAFFMSHNGQSIPTTHCCVTTRLKSAGKLQFQTNRRRAPGRLLGSGLTSELHLDNTTVKQTR